MRLHWHFGKVLQVLAILLVLGLDALWIRSEFFSDIKMMATPFTSTRADDLNYLTPYIVIESQFGWLEVNWGDVCWSARWVPETGDKPVLPPATPPPVESFSQRLTGRDWEDFEDRVPPLLWGGFGLNGLDGNDRADAIGGWLGETLGIYRTWQPGFSDGFAIRYRVFCIPMTGLVILVAGLKLRKRLMRRASRVESACPNCNYDLHAHLDRSNGLDSVCPECGSRFGMSAEVEALQRRRSD